MSVQEHLDPKPETLETEVSAEIPHLKSKILGGASHDRSSEVSMTRVSF